MRPLRLALSRDDFDELPRHPAYRYEYVNGEVLITPNPRFYHCRLDLESGPADDGRTRPWPGLVRPLREDDWNDLPELFALCFRAIEPFAGLNAIGALHAGRMALLQTREGGDGPLIPAGCLVAETADGLIGAALTTLLPLGDVTAETGFFWRDPPPEEVVASRHGRPHLTWIFVRPLDVARGVGSALLLAVCRELRTAGFNELISTFLEGNTASMLWHWRLGFALLQHPESCRRLLI